MTVMDMSKETIKMGVESSFEIHSSWLASADVIELQTTEVYSSLDQ
jgi:hypothetical protein